jgi:hypothetical protein
VTIGNSNKMAIGSLFPTSPIPFWFDPQNQIPAVALSRGRINNWMQDGQTLFNLMAFTHSPKVLGGPRSVFFFVLVIALFYFSSISVHPCPMGYLRRFGARQSSHHKLSEQKELLKIFETEKNLQPLPKTIKTIKKINNQIEKFTPRKKSLKDFIPLIELLISDIKSLLEPLKIINTRRKIT